MNALSKDKIEMLTDNAFSVTVEDMIPSTNTALKALAAKGIPEGTVLATEHQTMGRGRLGKRFYSPAGCGLYFSLLLRPKIPPEQCVFITVAAAVAVRRAMSKLFSIETQIKWVNDIYYGNKKFCGILTEAAISPNGQLAYAVLGIGLNLLPPPDGYPEEFAYKTTNLTEMGLTLSDDIRSLLLSEILNEFRALYPKLSKKTYLSEYRDASCVIGKDIEILTGPYTGPAKALDIDENANLIVLLPDGRSIPLSSGDVSIHL